MSGSALILPGAASASPFGKFHSYEGTWDGTVMLWDAGFDANVSVPAHGSVLANLCRNQMADLAGISLADSDFSVINETATGFIAAERTAKNGIHVASTQAGAQNAYAAFTLNASDAVKAWLLANTDAGANYSVLCTLWLRQTRAHQTTSSPSPWLALSHVSTPSASYFARAAGAANATPMAGNNVLTSGGGQSGPALDTPGVLAVVSKGWVGTKPLVSANMHVIPANVGARSGWGTANWNKAASAILYRAQVDIVDLSDITGGDTAAKAVAMINFQNALLAREFAPGGRFHGDTYTPAATLKP